MPSHVEKSGNLKSDCGAKSSVRAWLAQQAPCRRGTDRIGRTYGLPLAAERAVYREFFPRGLTALDDLDNATLGRRPNKSHVTAREEVITLLNALQLPLSENGKRHAAARTEWYSVMKEPLQVHEVVG